jgi:hypothetical protein
MIATQPSRNAPRCFWLPGLAERNFRLAGLSRGRFSREPDRRIARQTARHRRRATRRRRNESIEPYATPLRVIAE